MAFETRHRELLCHSVGPMSRSNAGLFQTIQDYGDAACEQSAAGDDDEEIAKTLVSADQVLKTSLHHQDTQRHRSACQKPP